MSEQAPRRTRQDAAKNRARILATAQELFARHGVEGVSMNRLAQEAEVGAGTLYRHFDSKSDLCFALIQDQLALLANQLASLAAAKNGDLHAALETMILRYLQFKEEKMPLFKGMEQTALHTGGAMQSPVYESLRAPFSSLFERAAREEGAGDPTDAVFRADMLLAALIGASLQFQSESRGIGLEEFAARASAVFYPHG